MRGLEWMTPQGKKTMRAGDHQAIQPMYVVRVTGGAFRSSAMSAATRAIGSRRV